MTDRTNRLIEEITMLAAELSGYAPGDLSPSAAFLALGFDSLFLTQFAAAVQKDFGVKTTFRQLIEKTTSIADLARHLDAAMPPEAQTETQIEESAPAKPAATAPSIAAAPAISVGAAPLADDEGMAAVFAAQLALMQEQIALLRGGEGAATSIGQADAAPAPAPPAVPQEETPALSETPPPTSISGGFGPGAIQSGQTLDVLQQAHLDDLIHRYNEKTAASKSRTQDHRAFFADPRTAAGFNPLWKEMVYPIVVEKSLGAHLWDIDGNQYIDLLNGFGPNFFGHRAPFIVDALKRQLDEGFEVGPQTPLAGEAAQLFCELTGMARVSWVNTGSEAVQAAIRVARTVTGRDKIVAFAGSYHGNFDEVLYSRAPTMKGRKTRPMAPGVPNASVENVMVLEYGEDEALAAIEENADEIAIVMVEPIQSRRPEFQPKEFLQKLRRLTKDREIVLLFDEVITGFRTGPGGAQDYFGVRADLATYGKVIGGGMPVGAIAGAEDFMDTFDGGMWRYGDTSKPTAGVTFFAGTFVRHPLAIAAVHAALSYMKAAGPALQEGVNAKTARLASALNAFFKERGLDFEIVHFASQMFFRTGGESDLATLFLYHLRNRGVHILEGFPSYMTAAHTDEDVDAVIAAAKDAVFDMQADGVLPVRAGVAPVLRQRTYPLTATQREMWIASQMSEKAACAFIESDTMEIVGAVDEARLVAAMADAANAREAFKTVFDRDGETQTVEPAITIGVNRLDLAKEDDAARAAALEAFFATQAARPFDLAKGPLVRLHLVDLGADRRLIVIYASHLVFDGYSADLFMRDVIARYDAAGGVDGAAALDIAPFRAFVEAVNAPGRHAEAEAYWTAVFKTPPAPLSLPTDKPYTDVRRFGGGTVKTHFRRETLDALRKFSVENGLSAASVATAAYAALLSHLSGADDVIVGAPHAGQAAEGVEAVGCCVSMAPLMATVDRGQPFRALAEAVKTSTLDAHDHLPVALGDLARALRTPRDGSRPPIVQAVFNYSRYFDAYRLGEADVRPMENRRRATQYELFLNLHEQPDGLAVDWDYSTDIYEASTIETWAALYGDLLRRVCTEDASALGATLEALPAGAAKTDAANEDRDNVAAPTTDAAFAPLSTPTEEIVAAVFKEMTGAATIGALDNFFDLGGRSLHAVRALALLRQRCTPALQLRDVFDAENVRELAARIDACVGGDHVSDNAAAMRAAPGSQFDEYEF